MTTERAAATATAIVDQLSAAIREVAALPEGAEMPQAVAATMVDVTATRGMAYATALTLADAVRRGTPGDIVADLCADAKTEGSPSDKIAMALVATSADHADPLRDALWERLPQDLAMEAIVVLFLMCVELAR